MDPQRDPLAAIYRTHWTPLQRKLMRLGVRPADVDDVLHDLFAALHRSLADAESPPRNLVAWVYASARNEALNHIKQDRRRLERFTPLDTDMLPPHETAPPPDSAEHLAAEERRRFLAEALTRMTPELRDVFEYRVFCRLTSEQTAEVLELPETTVLARYKAALAFLEAEYARWCARQPRLGAVGVPFRLATLIEYESGRLDAGASDAPDGGWTRFLAHAGGRTEASGAGAPIAPWRKKARAVATFISGGVVGAVVLWFFLNRAGFIVPPPQVCTEELRWILRWLPASPAHRESRSQDERQGEAAQHEQATPPQTSIDSAKQAALPSLTVPSATPGHDRPASVCRRAALPSLTVPSTPGHKPVREQDLIIAAHTAISEGRFAEARALLVRHAREFPQGDMKSAREDLRANLPR